jgi:hypothetical protein
VELEASQYAVVPDFFGFLASSLASTPFRRQCNFAPTPIFTLSSGVSAADHEGDDLEPRAHIPVWNDIQTEDNGRLQRQDGAIALQVRSVSSPRSLTLAPLVSTLCNAIRVA